MNINLNNKINEYVKKYESDLMDISHTPKQFIISLLSDILNCSIADIKLGNVKITADDLKKLEEMLSRICTEKIPPQYLTNTSYIYGLKFFVNENVLIPRQDTETIIETSIELINKNGYRNLLDMCTGSGVIGIAVSLNTNITNATLVDISKEALDVAKKNAASYDKYNKCSFVKSNMFDMLYETSNKYDIIVSNPPYLNKNEIKNISEYVKKEPSIALYGGRNGLDFYKTIYDNAKNF